MNELSDYRARVIAFYLPQYHPIPENDDWWGKGFTEWKNVTSAKPIFSGHIQPRIPADLGFYDLRLPETREAQAKLAKEAGIEGFCYWHYWFGNGKRLLQRPFEEVLNSGKPDFPFCLGWANTSWSNKTWEKSGRYTKEIILVEQTYDEKDHIIHFQWALKAFQDKRYMLIDGKPIFLIYRPLLFPDVDRFIKLWQKLALENGLDGIHFIGQEFSASFQHIDKNGINKLSNIKFDEAGERYKYILGKGFDSINSINDTRGEVLSLGRFRHFTRRVIQRVFGIPIKEIYDHRKVNNKFYSEEDSWENVFPCITPNWDDTPRRGKKGKIYLNSTPELFENTINKAIEIVKDKSPDHRIIFLRSWNEWGEGSYIEPDQYFGKKYLDVLKKSITYDY